MNVDSGHFLKTSEKELKELCKKGYGPVPKELIEDAKNLLGGKKECIVVGTDTNIGRYAKRKRSRRDKNRLKREMADA